MKKHRLILALSMASLLITSPAWSYVGSSRVSNYVYGEYYSNDNYTSTLFGTDEWGNPKTVSSSEYIGSVYDSKSGYSAGDQAAAIVSQVGTWTPNAYYSGLGYNSVDYNLSAKTEFGANHVYAGLSGYAQVDSSSTSYYVPSMPDGTPIPGAPTYQLDSQSSSNLYAYSQSTWEELWLTHNPFQTVGFYNQTYNITGGLGVQAADAGTYGSATLYWSLADFSGTTLAGIYAGYDVSSNTYWMETFSNGAWGNWTSGSGPLDFGPSGLAITVHSAIDYSQGVYLKSYLQASVSGNGIVDLADTVKLTNLEFEGGTSVYAASGVDLHTYGISFTSENGGGGVLCTDANCVTNGVGGGGGTVVPGVPEPETYAMMLAGLAMLGWVGRRRGR